MPATWQTVRVFISSTFSDMHAERDHLIKVVFPSLRERLEKYRIHLVDIDLRWGVTREQADDDRALGLCLQQIDECRPFFIGILGERYGYVPQELPNFSKPVHGLAQGMTGKSITELEIIHGVLNDHEMQSRSSFYFRDASVLEQVPATKRADMLSDSDESAGKLVKLKQAIRNADVSVYEDYPCNYSGLKISWQLARQKLSEERRRKLKHAAEDGIVDDDEYADLDENLRQFVDDESVVYLNGLERFGQAVHDQIWSAIKAQLELLDPPPTDPLGEADPLAQEADYHERFMESRLRVYIGRENMQRAMTKFAEDGRAIPCIVTGESGSGKSAALAKFVAEYREEHPDVVVIPHFVGASASSTDLRRMLRRFCLTLHHEFGFEDKVPREIDELITRYKDFLRRVPEDRRVLFVIDALNQLDETYNAQAMHWLPRELPPHVKVVVSCISDADKPENILQALKQRPFAAYQLEPLSPEEQIEIVRQIPSLSAKTLDSQQIGLLLANPATKNPLFLVVALEELRGFGSFDQVNERINAFPRYGDSVTAIFKQVIERLQEDFDAVLVRQILSLLECSRRGLTQRELLDLVADDPGSEDLFPILRQLRPYLQPRGELLDFFHRNLSKAVRAEYLTSPLEYVSVNRRIAHYYYRTITEIDENVRALTHIHCYLERLPPKEQLRFWHELVEHGYFVRRARTLVQHSSSIEDLMETRTIAEKVVSVALEAWDHTLAHAILKSYHDSRQTIGSLARHVIRSALTHPNETSFYNALTYLGDDATRWRSIVAFALTLHLADSDEVTVWLRRAARMRFVSENPADDLRAKKILTALVRHYRSIVVELVENHATSPGRWWLEVTGWTSLTANTRALAVVEASRALTDEVDFDQLARNACMLLDTSVRRDTCATIAQNVPASYRFARTLLALESYRESGSDTLFGQLLADVENTPMHKYARKPVPETFRGSSITVHKSEGRRRSASGARYPGPYYPDLLKEYRTIGRGIRIFYSDIGCTPASHIYQLFRESVNRLPNRAIASCSTGAKRTSTKAAVRMGRGRYETTVKGRVVSLVKKKQAIVEGTTSPTRSEDIPAPHQKHISLPTGDDAWRQELLACLDERRTARRVEESIGLQRPPLPALTPLGIILLHGMVLAIYVIFIGLIYAGTRWQFLGPGIFIMWIIALGFPTVLVREINGSQHTDSCARGELWFGSFRTGRVAFALLLLSYLVLGAISTWQLVFMWSDLMRLHIAATGVLFALTVISDLLIRNDRIHWVASTPGDYDVQNPKLERAWRQWLNDEVVSRSHEFAHFALTRLVRVAESAKRTVPAGIVNDRIWPLFCDLPHPYQWSVAGAREGPPRGALGPRLAEWMTNTIEAGEAEGQQLRVAAYCATRLAKAFPSEAGAVIAKIPHENLRNKAVSACAGWLAQDKRTAHRLATMVLDDYGTCCTLIDELASKANAREQPSIDG